MDSGAGHNPSRICVPSYGSFCLEEGSLCSVLISRTESYVPTRLDSVCVCKAWSSLVQSSAGIRTATL